MWGIPPEMLGDDATDSALIDHVLDQVVDPEGFARRIDNLYQGSEKCVDEIVLRDGRVFERYTAELAPNRIIPGRVWSFHDLTEHHLAKKENRRLEEQLQQSQKMEAIGTLAGGIAHDFNNILASIYGYVELARVEKEDSGKVQNHLDGIFHGAERAKELVEQILRFSRRNENERKILHLHVIIDETLKLLRASLPSTIEIKLDIDTDCPPLFADPTEMHRIILNLCTNAYQASQEGGGEIRISLHTVTFNKEDDFERIELPEGTYLELTISDDGVGMTTDIRSRVFEPYFTSRAKGEGTGLGLAVVHGIVRSYQGDIRVTSEPGLGSSFQVYLPASETNNETLPELERSEELGPSGNKRILFVDDDQVITEVNTLTFNQLGYETAAFTSSLECLDAFQNDPYGFDLLITDMTMPGMTGAELSKRVMEIRPDMPIILCSGFSEFMDAERAQRMGIRQYLLKPVTRTSFTTAIQKVFEKSSA